MLRNYQTLLEESSIASQPQVLNQQLNEGDLKASGMEKLDDHAQFVGESKNELADRTIRLHCTDSDQCNVQQNEENGMSQKAPPVSQTEIENIRVKKSNTISYPST